MRTSIDNIVTGNTGDIYKQVIQDIELQDTPHETFQAIWNAYEHGNYKSNNMNGHMFEYAVCEIFKKYNVGVLYFQCVFWGIPHD